MKPKQAKTLGNALLFTGAIIMLLGKGNRIILIVGGIIACTCLIPYLVFNRCPHCHKLLGRDDTIYCHNCGEPIGDDEDSGND